MTDFTPARLASRGLMYYWRTNAAVILGVATAVAVLTGALLVGDSVRGSLRDLVIQRLGKTDDVVVSSGFFREQLAEELRTHQEFPALFADICPVVVVQGFVTQQTGGGRAGKVQVYGVDDRFWKFHGVNSISGPSNRDALISPALARELGAAVGATILVRVQRPSDIPMESVHGRKDDPGRTIRLTVRSVLPPETLGEFSLQAQQGEVRAVFLPLARLQQDLEVNGRVNALLVAAKREDASAGLKRLVWSEAKLEDLGLKLRVLEGRNSVSLEADGGVLNEAQSTAALGALYAIGLRAEPIFTYLANSLRSGDRELPYSLVTAMDIPEMAPDPSASGPPPIRLNTWAARDLQVSKGGRVTMDYFVWEDPGRLATRTAEFTVADIVPIDTRDRDLAPVYPGITESTSLAGWDPPFPIDLRRIRPIDEEYWKLYRTAPKAFIHFAVGNQLWRSRHGSATSFRVTPEADGNGSRTPLEDVQRQFAEQLRKKLDPLAAGLTVLDVRAQGLQASRGATNFGEYFVYFSFFLVVSALLLAALFFKLSVEQRAREVGLLRAVGFTPRLVNRLFLSEGLLLAVGGAAIGVLGGIAYGYLMVAALRTWWIDAVGTSAIVLHVSPISLIAGSLGGISAALACIWFTLRGLARVSERRLLAGELSSSVAALHDRRSRLIAALGFFLAGVVLIVLTAAGLVNRTGAFFGAGFALLAACLCFFSHRFGRPVRSSIEGTGWWPVSRLGFRNATYRPARSVLAIAMIASATFILISVDAFRRGVVVAGADPHSGTGGYSLLVDSLLPVVHDPRSPEGRAMLGIGESGSITVEPFRVRPGDDASCLNLYEPKNPRILAPDLGFIAAGRFAFQNSLASTDAERKDPWLLLLRREEDEAIPVIADANSMTYVLHRKLGEDFVITVDGRAVHLRLVAALDDSIFQSELLMSRENFQKLFPEQQGYQFFLIETPPGRAEAVAASIESALGDFGADAKSTGERLAEFHRVENTYLSTFQMLGGLGLLLGTVGLGAVLLRNVFERRRELALLRALGFQHWHFLAMVIAENALLLVGGLLTGAGCAILAIGPVLLERGGRLPALSVLLLIGGVLASGLLTSIVATAAALRSSLLPALRSE